MRKDLTASTDLVVFVGCSAAKRQFAEGKPPVCSAQEMYQGELFKLQRRWASLVGGGLSGWYILSAKYGILCPGTAIETYEQTLETGEDRRRWGAMAREQFRTNTNYLGAPLHLPTGDNVEYMVFAGVGYREWLIGETDFENIIVPLAGLGIGHQKQAMARSLAYLERTKVDGYVGIQRRQWAMDSLAIGRDGEESAS